MPRLIDADAVTVELIKWRDNDTHRKSRSLVERWVRNTGINVLIRVLNVFPSVPYAISPRWIPVTERVPMKEEYLAKAKDGEEYMERLLIAYQSDTVEYAIGYYDGFKWLTEMPMRRITDVIAWKPFFPLPEQPGADLP